MRSVSNFISVFHFDARLSGLRPFAVLVIVSYPDSISNPLRPMRFQGCPIALPFHDFTHDAIVDPGGDGLDSVHQLVQDRPEGVGAFAGGL